MKLLISALIFASAFVTACSGGGGGNGVPNMAEIDFKPFENPADPAPEAYVDEILQYITKSEELIPADPAIFRAVLSGAMVRTVSDSERDANINKLNAEGKDFLDNSLKECVGSVSGSPENQSGEMNTPIKRAAQMLFKGQGCAYEINDQVSNEMILSSQETGKSYSATQSGTYSRTLSHAKMIALSGLKSVSATLGGTAYGFVSATSENDAASTETVRGQGQVQLELANGDKISGPIMFKGKRSPSKSDLAILFDGKSKKGAIRLVYQLNEDYSVKVHINGSEVAPQKIGPLRNLFMLLN